MARGYFTGVPGSPEAFQYQSLFSLTLLIGLHGLVFLEQVWFSHSFFQNTILYAPVLY